MIKTITLKATGNLPSVGVDPEAVKQVLSDVLSAARGQWIKYAGERLSGMGRVEYLAGIQEVQVNGFVGGIALVGLVPNLIEGGQDPFDMHKTLLGSNVPVVPPGAGMKGKHKRKGGPGYWRVIPFRHQTPGTLGAGGGAPMGSAYQGVVSNALALGKAVHKAALNLSATIGMPGQATQWGGALKAGLAPKLKPIHSTDIYAGMYRVQKTYQAATQNTYVTFRTISDAVPGKWLHPGVQARNIAADVQKYIEKVAPQAFAVLAGP